VQTSKRENISLTEKKFEFKQQQHLIASEEK
jgi:hypothetical protein